MGQYDLVGRVEKKGPFYFAGRARYAQVEMAEDGKTLILWDVIDYYSVIR